MKPIEMKNMHPELLKQIEEGELCNYRINLYFTGEGTDYWKDFHKLREHYDIIAAIFHQLKQNNVEHMWFFFEPYIEITWLQHKNCGQQTLQEVVEFVQELGFTTYEKGQEYHQTYTTASSKDGLTFCDWFDCNKGEKFFGALRYSGTSKVALSYYTCREAVDAGKGPNKQFMRSIHSLANQMGLNYRAEGWYAVKRGVFCLLIWMFHKVFPKRSMNGYLIACFIYEKILRLKDVR